MTGANISVCSRVLFVLFSCRCIIQIYTDLSWHLHSTDNLCFVSWSMHAVRDHFYVVLFLCVATYRNPELEHVATENELAKIQAYKKKLAVIGEVLSRRHMKVAFFGR